jgi:hypothetical protein
MNMVACAVAVCSPSRTGWRFGYLYWVYAGLGSEHFGSTIMSKEQDSRREGKKQPLKTAKEKKKDKQAKKQEANPVKPFLKE